MEKVEAQFRPFYSFNTDACDNLKLLFGVWKSPKPMPQRINRSLIQNIPIPILPNILG